MMTHHDLFFDYLHLGNTDFSQIRLIVFSGKSGAGKSTYINHLIKNNSSFNNHQIKIYAERPMSWKTIQNKKQTLIIDEVKTPFELYYIIKLLLRGNTLLVANHAPIFLFRIIGLFTLITIFKIDTQTEKITHYLDSQNYHYSHKTIEEFCNTFGSNYKILQIILETATESDFDSTYYRFIRFNKIREQACDPVN